MDMNGGVKKISIIVQLTTSLTMSVRQSILSINFPPPFTALVREPYITVRTYIPELKTEEGYSADIVPTYIPREML